MSTLLCLLLVIGPIAAMDNLNVKFEWRKLDFDFLNEQTREEALQSREYVPENNVPFGIEVHKQRIFITVPRWKKGVAASLAYISLSGNRTSLPLHFPFQLCNRCIVLCFKMGKRRQSYIRIQIGSRTN